MTAVRPSAKPAATMSRTMTSLMIPKLGAGVLRSERLEQLTWVAMQVARKTRCSLIPCSSQATCVGQSVCLVVASARTLPALLQPHKQSCRNRIKSA